jgi:GGDEF domain-containing protein
MSIGKLATLSPAHSALVPAVGRVKRDALSVLLEVACRVGAAISIDGEVDAEAVLTRTDAAMYEVKRPTRTLETAVPA